MNSKFKPIVFIFIEDFCECPLRFCVLDLRTDKAYQTLWNLREVKVAIFSQSFLTY